MAYEFKRLADAELLESVPDGATAFVEVEGVVKRVPGDGLGGGGIPTAIFQLNTDSGDAASTLAAEDGSRAGTTIYTATCTNMTYDEAKAILLSGQPLDARLMGAVDVSGVLAHFDTPSISGGCISMDEFEAVGFAFLYWDQGYARTTFYWLPDGTITTDQSAILG